MGGLIRSEGQQCNCPSVTRNMLAQLKIMQEVITLGVFVPFAPAELDQPLKLDLLWAGLCLVGAVYVVFGSS